MNTRGYNLNIGIDYREIFKLYSMLKSNGIPFSFEVLFNGFHIEYPCSGRDRICSVILQFGSYGEEQGLLEICGLLTEEEKEQDSVAGWLTADDVFKRIKNAWDAHSVTNGNALSTS